VGRCASQLRIDVDETMGLLTPEHRARFDSWLRDRPDGSILRKLFAMMIAGTVTVLALDYLELSGLREQLAATLPDISTDAVPAARPGDQPTIGPLRAPDGVLAAKMTFDLIGDGRLRATGTIQPGTARIFAAEVEKRGGYIKTIVLHSPGGSVSDALEMGRLIRKMNFSTQVEAGRYCVSSCPLVFAGGVERRAGAKAIIGVHQVSALARAGAPGAGMADAQRISAVCQNYLHDMGVDLQVWTHAMETPRQKLYSFKRDELLTLKLATEAGGKAVAESAKKKG
jgi:hypothetical protein